tara:strand:+ start:16051 stop:17139 length:1089 start_codon:yes stop_codon:yes gene_type:complete
MVNYDKWDKLEVSDDESDGYGKSDRRVGVTKLDGPSKVTFGGGASDVVTIDSPLDGMGDGMGKQSGDGIEEVLTPGVLAARAQQAVIMSHPKSTSKPNSAGTDYAKFDSLANEMSSDDDDREYFEDEAWEAKQIEDQRKSNDEKQKAPPSDNTSVDILQTRTDTFSENGGREVTCPGADKNNNDGDETSTSSIAMLWSQTREEVTVSVVVPNGTKAKDVAVRCTATNVEVACMSKQSLTNAIVVAKCFLSDRWTHAVDPEPADDDDDDEFAETVYGDWEVCDWEGSSGKRVVRITVIKKNLGGNMVHWWKKGTEGGCEIDVTSIAARKPGAAYMSSKIWSEATEAFKKRVKERVPIEVDCGE